MRLRRYQWAQWMLGLRHRSQWYYENLVWPDICTSVLPRSEKKATEQALARKNGKAWMSQGCQQDDKNLRGDTRSVKLNSWGTVRVWWAPVLARGKLHAIRLPENCVGDHPDGAWPLVAKVRAALHLRCPAASGPRVMFVGRGSGVFKAGSGTNTKRSRPHCRTTTSPPS